MARTRALRTLTGVVLWSTVSAAVTFSLWTFRDSLDQAQMAMSYLLVVLGGSAREGRLVGLILAILSFLLFNFFLLPPLYTLAIESPLDWWILVTFLITGGVAAELLHREQRAAALAEQRAQEITRLAEEASKVEALREADRMKDALLASVSHDLRTPLTSIRATAAELRAEGHAPAAIIEEEAERLGRFVSDLLDYSRIRGGAAGQQVEVNAAEDLVGAALERTTGLVGADRIVVRMPGDGSVPVGRFDFVQALQSLANLVENALRHGASDEPVEIIVEQSEGQLVIAVVDHGPGIQPDEAGSLFEPFQRGARARGTPGSGLGLAIARDAARAQAGDVTYLAGEGGGCRFVLRLPGADIPGLS